MSGSLLVVTGPPGSGKSTVARLLADRLDHSVLVEGDAFFAFLASGAIEPWLPESNAQNGVVTAAAAAATAATATEIEQRRRAATLSCGGDPTETDTPAP